MRYWIDNIWVVGLKPARKELGMVRSIALAVLASTAALLGSVTLANPAYACTTSHHFIGAYGITEPANTLFATRVEMTTDAAKQNCQSASVWPMLYDPGGSPDTEFAQIGLLQEHGQIQQYVYSEYATTTSHILPCEFFVAPSGKYANKVVYNSLEPSGTFIGMAQQKLEPMP